MRRVVARVALGQPHAEVLRARRPVMRWRLRRTICTTGSVFGTSTAAFASRPSPRSSAGGNSISYRKLGSSAASASRVRRMSATTRLPGLARVEAHVDVRGAEVADGVGAAQLVVAAAPADDRADVEARQAGQVRVVDVGEPHRRRARWMARIISAMASTPCSFLLMWVARPSVWITTSMVPVCLVRMVWAP